MALGIAGRWRRLSGTQRLVLAVGVPLAGGAALLANLRDRRAATPEPVASGVSGDVLGFGTIGGGVPVDPFPDSSDLLLGIGDLLAVQVEAQEAANESLAGRIADDLREALGDVGATAPGMLPAPAPARPPPPPPPAPAPAPIRYLPLTEASIRALFRDYPQCFKPSNGAQYWVNGFLGRGTPGVDAAQPSEWPDFWRAYACTGLPR